MAMLTHIYRPTLLTSFGFDWHVPHDTSLQRSSNWIREWLVSRVLYLKVFIIKARTCKVITITNSTSLNVLSYTSKHSIRVIPGDYHVTM